jgi:hypothetical protein
MKRWLVPLLLLGTSAYAFELKEIPFDENVRSASVVLIGAVETVDKQPVNSRRASSAQVKVESILKGKAAGTVCVQTRHANAEESFVVAAGRRYLFLLTKYEDCYLSVNGHFAVIPVDGKSD